MKLNNNGWGYPMMIFLISLLCFFLLIAVYYIYRYYDKLTMKNYYGIKIVNVGSKL